MIPISPAAGPGRRFDGPARVGLLAAALLVSAVSLASLALPPGTLAFERDLRAARTRYPGIADTRLDACALCHVSGHDLRLNPYGRAYVDAGRDFARIEGDDSDGDGYGNMVEIAALTFPGDPADHPSSTPTTGPTVGPSETPVATPVLTLTPPTGSPPPTGPSPTDRPTDAPSVEPTGTIATTGTAAPGAGSIFLPRAERP